MKKTILLLVAFFCFASGFTFSSFAADEEAYIPGKLTQELEAQLFENMDGQVKDALEYFGIDGVDFSGVFDFSFGKLLEYFTPDVKEKLKDALKNFFFLLSALLLLGIFSVGLPDSQKDSAIFLPGAVIIALMGVGAVESALSCCISALELSGRFMLCFIPAFTLIISFSGNPTASVTYNSAVLFICEAISFLINNGLVEFIGCYFCLAIGFSFNPGLKTGRIIAAAERSFSFFLGISSSLFAGLLSLKNVFSLAADRLSAKGVRFLLSSLVPVIGSSMAEAFSTVLAGLELIKGSVAVIGILALLIINIPVILENLLYFMSFAFLSYVADILELRQPAALLKSFCFGMKMLLLLVVFELFLLVISTGIMLSFKNS